MGVGMGVGRKVWIWVVGVFLERASALGETGVGLRVAERDG